MSEQKSSTNDYAVAKALNERVWKILWYFADLHPLYDNDRNVVDKSYIFLVQELEQIYAINQELQDIDPKAVWQSYELIEGNEQQIIELQNDRTGDTGQAHTAKVKRLCYISGVDEPVFTPRQKKLIDEADRVITTLARNIEEEKAHLEAIRQQKRDWYISEYTLTYNEVQGAIKINGVYRLNKRSTNYDSNVDKLLKQAFAKPNELFVPELNSTKKNISTILSNAGLDATLRKLFFPTARLDRGILCRPVVTRAEVDAEGIDTTELDMILKEAGATTKPL